MDLIGEFYPPQLARESLCLHGHMHVDWLGVVYTDPRKDCKLCLEGVFTECSPHVWPFSENPLGQWDRVQKRTVRPSSKGARE